MTIDNPPTPDIPTLPDDTQPGPVPPMGPSPAQPDDDDFPLEPDSPDNIEPQTDHPQSQ